MIEEIGIIAGEVYRVLEQNGPMTVAQLKTALKTDTFLIDAAIGWLARENNIYFEKYRASFKIALR